MAKVAVLVPGQDMADYARSIAKEMGSELHLIKVIDTPNAVDEARRAVESGANIIVARGLQAQLIIQQTNIPVIEIKLTGQELGLLVQKAKAMAGKDSPVIAFVGFRNFFSSMSRFEQLYGITLRIYYAESIDDLQRCVDQASEDGVDVLVGGEIALHAAGQAGIPAIFYEATEESVWEALYIARRAAYAADMERLYHAQTEAILDISASGILKVDRSHMITMSNRMMEELLQTRFAPLVGKELHAVIPAFDHAMLDEILSGKQERLTISLRLRDDQFMVSAAPVDIDGVIDGVILTFHRLVGVSMQQSSSLRERYLHGHMARANFEQILFCSSTMKKQVELARAYALSGSPIIIYGETGTEKELMAQAIHNNSSRRNQPYVSVGCFADAPQAQYEMLFGKAEAAGDAIEESKGALQAGNFGTVVIHNIDRLSARCQHELLQTMQNKALVRGNVDRMTMVDVRIIATSALDLSYAVKKGSFLPEMYYALGALALELPSLRDEPGRIRELAQHYIGRFIEQYAKFVSLEPSAWVALEQYPWHGNLLQLEAFCERLVAGAHKKRIDGDILDKLLASLYPEIRIDGGVEKIMVLKNPEAVRIAELLEKHGGSRKAVAEEMGVSAATLWRRIKKYGVNTKYGI